MTRIDHRPSRLVHFWMSPVGCVLISYLVFLLILCIPSAVYEEIVRERDVMIGNVGLWLFVTFCTLIYLGGVFLARSMGGAQAYAPRPVPQTPLLPYVILLVLTAAMGLDAMSTAMIAHNTGDIIGRLASGGGAALKATLNTEGAMTEALPLLYAITCWASVRYDQRPMTQPWAWFLLRLAVTSAVGLAAISALIKLARFEVIPFILAMFIVQARQKIMLGQIRWRFVLLTVVVAPTVILGLFFLFAALRGGYDFRQQLYAFFGYGPASYNRLALILAGNLRYALAGHMDYVIGFLYRPPLLHFVFDGGHMLHMPDPLIAFASEFGSVHQSGFDPAFIWGTALGYVYSDLGWGVLVWCFAIGFMTEKAWASFNRGGPVGSVLYPFMAVAVMLWGTFNLLTQPRVVTYFAAACAVTFIEAFIVMGRPTRYLTPAGAISGAS